MNWKPSKVFYGWWIVSASFLIALYAGGTVIYGFTAIFEPIANDMGWSYMQVSLAASIRGVEMGILAPLVGLLADRWGPRRLVFSGAIIIATGLTLLSYATSLGMFYGAFALISIGVSCSAATVLMTAIASWFRSKVGIASGIVASGFGSGGLLVPVIVRLIEAYDWRTTMTILALGMLVIVLPLSFLLRHKPEQYGYLPDGQLESRITFNNGPSLSQAGDIDIKPKQALKSRAFWCITLAYICYLTLVSSITSHVMPYLSSIGIVRSKSSMVATALPLMSIVGRLSFGWLGDKLDRKVMAAEGFAMMGVGVLCFGYVSAADTWLLVPFLIIFGIGFGGNNALRPAMAREYFGRTNFGTIFGFIMGINMLGALIGPPLAGWAYDNWGSYQRIWLVFAGLALVALISVLTVSPIRTSGKHSIQT